MNWVKEYCVGEYTLWRHKEGHYQVTRGEPPRTEGGYGGAMALLKLKGVIS